MTVDIRAAVDAIAVAGISEVHDLDFALSRLSAETGRDRRDLLKVWLSRHCPAAFRSTFPQAAAETDLFSLPVSTQAIQ